MEAAFWHEKSSTVGPHAVGMAWEDMKHVREPHYTPQIKSACRQRTQATEQHLNAIADVFRAGLLDMADQGQQEGLALLCRLPQQPLQQQARLLYFKNATLKPQDSQ